MPQNNEVYGAMQGSPERRECLSQIAAAKPSFVRVVTGQSRLHGRASFPDQKEVARTLIPLLIMPCFSRHIFVLFGHARLSFFVVIEIKRGPQTSEPHRKHHALGVSHHDHTRRKPLYATRCPQQLLVVSSNERGQKGTCQEAARF